MNARTFCCLLYLYKLRILMAQRDKNDNELRYLVNNYVKNFRSK